MPDWLHGMRWGNPLALLLIPAVIMLMIRRWRQRPPSLRFSMTHVVPHSHVGVWAARMPWLLETFALSCLILALARPQRGIETSKRRPKGVDVIIALDVSGSMDAIDLPRRTRERAEVSAWLKQLDADGEPREQAAKKLLQLLNTAAFPSRLEAAKEQITEFISKRPNDRIGIVVFSGNSFTLCPPTLDHAFLQERLNNLETGILNDATTRLAPPITSAVNRLRDADSKRRLMLLFTDGESLRPGRLTPLEAAQLAAKFNITIHTIGLGSDYGFVANPTLFGTNTYMRIDHFDPELLVKIAEITDGEHFLAEDKAALASIMNWIDAELVPTSREAPQYTEFAELFIYPTLVGLLLLLLALALRQVVFRRIP